MKKIIFIIFLIVTSYLFLSINLLNRSIIDNDEGIYWATFLLANKGYKLYSEIAFSQLPGFFISVYGIFKLFGSTIFSARLAVFYWSVLALLSVVWLGYIRKNLLSSLVSIVLLISIPIFFNQSITLQSDIIAASFSTLSLVFMISSLDSRLRGNDNIGTYIWIILSSLFFVFAILAKFDYSLVFPFGFILFTLKKNRITNIFLFAALSIFTIFVTLNFFGINVVLSNVLTLREKALTVYPFEPFKVFEYLKKDTLLFTLILVNIFYSVFKFRKDITFLSLFLWFISSLLLVFSFRPLFSHHLVFLVVPSVLLFSNQFTSVKRIIKVKVIIILIVGILGFTYNFNQLSSRQKFNFIKEREVAKKFILENTKKNDFIITDEAALYGMTGRLPPPELVDLSFVQIRSGNISPEKFQSAIIKYKPKLIIAWNGRLKEMNGFKYLIKTYKKIDYPGNKKIYFLN